MRDFPSGWQKTEIGKIAQIETGGTPSKAISRYFGGPFPFFKPGDLNQGGLIECSEDTLTADGIAIAKRLPAESLLVTCIGKLGKSALTG